MKPGTGATCWSKLLKIGSNTDRCGERESGMKPNGNNAMASAERYPQLRQVLGDISGAFADLGTFLPLVIGVLTVQRFDPTGLLVGFGLFALLTALVYRRPVPVQPMKAVAAIVIATGIGPEVVAAGGLIIGVVLVLLAVTGAIAALSRWLPQTVLTGIQLAVGLHLALAGFRLMESDWLVGAIAVTGLLALQRTRFKPLAALLLLVLATSWALASNGGMPHLSPGLYLPGLALPAWTDIGTAIQSLALPQLPLTLANAVLAPAAIAASLFPGETDRITPRRLALSSGLLNLSLAPMGAFPMCHGAGGLVAQHKFGARTGLAPAVFGTTCLGLGLMLGPDAVALLGLLPMAAVGALLMIAGGELTISKRLFDAGPGGLAIILLTGSVGVMVDITTGLFAGLSAELLRTWIRRLKSGAAHSDQ